MSNNDSLDEETKRILAEVEPDAQSGSNDSRESSKKKSDEKEEPKEVKPDKKDFDEYYNVDDKEIKYEDATDDMFW